jgi:putative ABC transport system permease protein
MFENYLKITLRNIFKHKGHTFINIFGLSVGITCCLLLLLWIQDELSYDRYHENADRIYRVISQYEVDGKLRRSAATSAPLAPAVINEFPEVEKAVRFGVNGFLVCYKDKCFSERIFFSDPEIFNVFNIPLIQGDPKSVLKEPYSIIISEKMRKKYFSQKDPIGEILNIDKWHALKITGVFKNIPRNSHFRFDFLGNFSDYVGKNSDKWGISNYYTYILISRKSSCDKITAKLLPFIEKYRGKEAVAIYKTKYILQPLSRIHLHSHLRNEIEPNNDIRVIYIFSAIALFIFIIACLNYINLSTAIYIKRIKEIGLRKVLGAIRFQLVNQFLFEAFFFSLIALSLAMILSKLLLPHFNSISGKQLMIGSFDNLFLLICFFSIFVLVGVVSGLFPAIIISYMQPVNALKGILKSQSKISLLRKLLVVFQFTLAIVFIINTLIILNQVNFIKNKELGFNQNNLIYIPIHNKAALEKYETIKNEFLKNANVKAVCASSFFPEKNYWYVNYWREGIEPGKNPMISCINVDADFFETFDIKLLKGRTFSKHFPADKENTYILNESAVKELNWKSPIGKKFKLGYGKMGTVIGVIEDFNFRTLHHSIKPLVLYFSPHWFSYFSVKLDPRDIPETLNILKNKWRELVPDQLFEYTFLEEDLDNLYSSEARLGKIFIVVTILSIFIACLGLLGLVIFGAEQRTKEIGIRKVLGASVFRIYVLISKEFAQCILLANIIAWPIAWYVMNKWLQNFPYRAGIGIWIFFLAGLIAFVIALLILSYKTINTASANPLNALRYE